MRRHLVRTAMTCLASTALAAALLVSAAEQAPAATPTFFGISKPKVSGTKAVGKKLTAKPDTKTKPEAESRAYQWLRNGVSIEGATQNTYTLNGADRGNRISVKVCYLKAGYSTKCLTSSKTSKIAYGKFSGVSKPVIGGTKEVGSTLTANPDLKTSPKATSFSYQWYRNSSKVSKATKATYTLVKADQGKAISVKVCHKALGYKSKCVTSPKTSKIKPAPARLSSGSVWAWGLNDSGQLGDGTTKERNVPVRVSALVDVVAVRAFGQPLHGHNTAFAITDDGTVWAWGSNASRLLGEWWDECPDNPNSECPPDALEKIYREPVRVDGLANVVDISAAKGMVAVKKDGTVWKWGGAAPEDYGEITGVKAISGGTLLRSDGTVWVFDDDNSPFTFGGTHDRPDVQMSGLFDVIAISGNYSPYYRYECAPGYEDACGVSGRTGHYRLVPYGPSPQYFGSGYALESDGTVWSWGRNDNGQLGDGTTTDRMTPVQVLGLTDISAIFAARGSAFAVKKDGSVWRWGKDSLRNDGGYFDTPVQMDGLTNVASVFGNKAGQGTYAIKKDGTVWSVDYLGKAVKMTTLNGITSGDCWAGSCYVVVG